MIENVSPRQTWEALEANPDARLVDVRTDAEWTYVGLPDLSAAGKQPALIPWQMFPTGAVNQQFVEQMRAAGLAPQHHVYFLCRSGARSLAAAQAAQGAGFPHVYNIANGFEGVPDQEAHRGTVTGWKAEGLPWRQR